MVCRYAVHVSYERRTGLTNHIHQYQLKNEQDRKVVMNNELRTVREILDGNVEKYAELMKASLDNVSAIVSRRIPESDVENMVQECFIRAYDSLASFSGHSPFGNWLARISVRTCCDYWRKQGRRRQVIISEPQESQQEWLETISKSNSLAEFEKLSHRAECRELLEVALKTLGPEDRALIEMIYFDGWPLGEAAKTLDWGLAKTKVRAMRARKKMRKYIESLGEKYHG